jgi:succinyldiaminopimelate transaminase
VRTVSAGLPDFPWDLLVPYQEKARAHPGGVVDLSVGTPVDPVPDVVQRALAEAANAHGYPLTTGSPALRSAIFDWVSRRCGAANGFDVLPTIGSKELIAGLPSLLGLGASDTLVIPELAYPTYEVGARLSGAQWVRSDVLPPSPAALLWLNSPSNPTGRVLDAGFLRDAVAWARSRGAVVVSDECYLELGWSASPVSILSVCDGDFSNVLAVHSLSKRSNLAGYRAGFVAGDPTLVRELLAIRKHAGMMAPTPVQAAMAAALADDDHVAKQRMRYGNRRDTLRLSLEGVGFRVDHSEAGLYLWATRDEDCWSTVDWFAQRGILVAPGSFYGPAGDRHVRVALTGLDERVAAAADRLAGRG